MFRDFAEMTICFKMLGRLIGWTYDLTAKLLIFLLRQMNSLYKQLLLLRDHKVLRFLQRANALILHSVLTEQQRRQAKRTPEALAKQEQDDQEMIELYLLAYGSDQR